MNAVRIPDDLLPAIYAHARAAYPAECCGYLVGAAGSDAVDERVACTNAHGAGDHRAFAIDGAELLAFARTFATPRPAHIVYHSHPNGRAYFSQADRSCATLGGVARPGEAGAAAAPAGPTYDVQHLVIGVAEAGATEAAQFAWSAQAGDFVEVARWSVLD
ncbi:MAG TPA: Mov34/MPN/PAD-1 family protein [Kofleriaceae bacterium]|jgi:proteasome lid subunit RPN8/RPN11